MNVSRVPGFATQRIAPAPKDPARNQSQCASVPPKTGRMLTLVHPIPLRSLYHDAIPTSQQWPILPPNHQLTNMKLCGSEVWCGWKGSSKTHMMVIFQGKETCGGMHRTAPLSDELSPYSTRHLLFLWHVCSGRQTAPGIYGGPNALFNAQGTIYSIRASPLMMENI
ncbi:hypothetical protein BKA80DRAFT_33864 [Phyllosticta citrichinensis]